MHLINILEKFTKKHESNSYLARSHYSETASALDFKGATALRFGHIKIVFCLFVVANVKRYCLSIISRNENKNKKKPELSNNFGPVMPKIKG